MTPRLRRVAGLATAPTLVLAALTALPATSARAAEVDPAPAAAGAAWVEGQLTDGLIVNTAFGDPFHDYGLSIDAGLALIEVGGHDATVDAISDAVATHVADPGDEFPYLGDGTDESYAGPLAKAAVFARAAGDDPTSFGGRNLVEALEKRVLTDGAAAGRIQDQSAFGDFANVFGQTFAVRALDEAGSTLADAATDFLIDQQCTSTDGEVEQGFFRQDFAPIDATDQACDAASAEPSTDATALAVLALLPQADDTDVKPVIDAAVAWLLEEQASDGWFASGSEIPVANANSTGLAGWALGAAGEELAAQRAAAFVRLLQVDEPAPCQTALAAEQGAIAYDGAALADGRKNGITTALEDQWRRASVQALPALQWAPDDVVGAGSIVDDFRRYHRPGQKVVVTATGRTPGETVCFTLKGKAAGFGGADLSGIANGTVVLPKGTATRTYAWTDGEDQGVARSFQVLDAKKLRLGLKGKVARRGTQVVKIRGLAPRESFRTIFRGKKVVTGHANGKGRAVARFKVGKKTGPVRVLVLGEFKNRRASKAFTVTR